MYWKCIHNRQCGHSNEHWWHIFGPITVALFPVLHLAAKNIGIYAFSDVIYAALFFVLAGLVISTVCWAILRCLSRAATLSATVILLFISYGYVLDAVRGWSIADIVLGRIRFVVLLFILVFILIFVMVIRSRVLIPRVATALIVVGVFLVGVSFVTIVSSYLLQGHRITLDTESAATSPADNIMMPAVGHRQRDIYYIILDGYARDDVLTALYDFDNALFLDDLRKRGFFVARASASNYATSAQSIPSALNMDYVFHQVVDGNNSAQYQRALEVGKQFTVARFLKEHGYTFVYLVPGRSNFYADQNIRCGRFNEFTYALIRMSMARLFEHRLVGDDQRERILCKFDRLKDISKNSEPTFTFAHILSPHPPYVFDRDGNPIVSPELATISGWEHPEIYVEQIRFLNKKILALIDELLHTPDDAPIIIIQADHGPGSLLPDQESWAHPSLAATWERMSILNAYYLPNGENEELYNTISPVNTFRYVFNHYFDASFDLLDDRSYFSSYEYPEQFTDVTDQIRSRPDFKDGTVPSDETPL